MKIKDFIKEHRQEIDEEMRYSGYRYINDKDRRQWIDNVEHWYIYAKQRGCKI